MKYRIHALMLMIGVIACTNARSEMLTFSFSDAIGDNRPGYADVSMLSVVFENTTGDYRITLRSTESARFEGWLQANVNLVNPDTPRFITSQSYFFDSGRKVILDGPTTVVTWTGNASSLKLWNIGDRVATSSEPFGIAKFTPPHSFASAVNQGVNYSQWGTDDFSTSQIATISAVPEPELYAMFLIGFGVIALRRRDYSAKLSQQ